MALRSPSCLLPLLLVFLVPAACQDATCTNTDPCTDPPDCTGCTPGDYVPDPENCRGYYICISATEPSDMPFDCEEGQVFNASAHECQKGDDCEECSVVPGGKCSYGCPATGSEIVSIPTDCHSYYKCEDGAASIVTCEAPTPFFDGEDCQDDERLCCHCLPYCTADVVVGTFVIDPQDCRNYYFCTAPSSIPTSHGTCDDGENFDAVLQGCSASAPCAVQASCLNVVDADGCIDPFTCVSAGYFARCPKLCTPEYYHCTAATGDFQAVESCTGGTVFHPDTHNCVSPDSCPYEGERKPAVATRTHWMFPAPKA